jgi:hypothetical protein
MHKKFLVRNPVRRDNLGDLRYKWTNNIKTYLTEIGHGDVAWINLAPDRDQWLGLVSVARNF